MKKQNNYLLLVLLLITSIVLSVTGLIGESGIYSEYHFNPETEVLLSLPLKGLSDGIFPVSAIFSTREKPEETPDSSDTEALADPGAASSVIRDDGIPASDEALTKDAQPEQPEDTGGERPQAEPEDELPADVFAEDDESTPARGEGARPAEPDVPDAASGAPANDTYYADALFIGDSRTVGLSQYVPGLDQYATFYCAVSLSVFNAMSAPIVNMDGTMVSVDQALQEKQFGKIYIMVGINEIGYAREAWLETYLGVVSRIRELQPSAIIYVQSIMHVSSEKEAAQPVFNNPEIDARNEGLRAMTNGNDVVYMDINYLLDDANGALSAELTFDGVHLTAGAYDLWYQEIKAQTR